MPRFIENKKPDLARIKLYLDRCHSENRWANRGPIYDELADRFAQHVDLPPGLKFIPCANGGIALEAMARLLAVKAGRRLRWVCSAFSFSNLGRGYFEDVLIVDCDPRGLLDLNICSELPINDFDGLVLTNPHGCHTDFRKFTNFAKALGKALIIDNAGGMSTKIPDLPWQSFSLHQTKPYGVGEGGLALVPAEFSEDFYRLIAYDLAPSPAHAWLNNGKISDISCAFILDRLERAADWRPLYFDQAARVTRIAVELGFQPLRPPQCPVPTTSVPMLAASSVSIEHLRRAPRLPFAKFYKPLKQLPQVNFIFDRLVNVAAHPDIASLTDSEIASDLAGLTEAGKSSV